MNNKNQEEFIQWNLESTAQLLSSSSGYSPVLVVRPSRFESNFSCFDNFVACNKIGSPSHQPNYNSLQHMASLLESTDAKLIDLGLNPLTDYRLIFIGFSKGCVVLNQFVHEFCHYYSNLQLRIANRKVFEMIGRIKKMFWIDGGHSGRKDTWITSSRILSALAKMGQLFPVKIKLKTNNVN